jgi:hypothetical protein
MNLRVRNIGLAGLVALISACSSMTTISSPDSGTTFALKDKTLSLPVSQDMKGTSFGNYEFRATETGSEPFYGILPLRFKGGHLAADIILFAPAAFFNLREAFPFYDIDVKNGVIRYKNKATDGWIEYKPKPKEAARAQNYFNAKTVAK